MYVPVVHRQFGSVFAALVIVYGCSPADSVTPQASVTATQQGLKAMGGGSSGFFMGEDGYYRWDGSIPSGDAGPAEILEAQAGGRAPHWNTQGWASGRMQYIGDQYNIELIYSVTSRSGPNQPEWTNVSSRSGWKWWGEMWNTPSPRHYRARHDTELPTTEQCGYSLQVGGTTRARKAIPFGVDISLIKFEISITPGSISWGETSLGLVAFSDEGIDCDLQEPPSSCDDEDTAEIEHCPPEDDPFASPSIPGGSGGPTVHASDDFGTSDGGSQDTDGKFGCTYGTHWFISYDGGQTWNYDWFQCHQWGYL